MDQSVEKLLYSRRDTAEALSLSVRSVDYLITAGRLPMRRVGGKILIPAGAVRRFAREDHPESVRAENVRPSIRAQTKQEASGASVSGFGPRSETMENAVPIRADGRR
jgi:hypothetical protein